MSREPAPAAGAAVGTTGGAEVKRRGIKAAWNRYSKYFWPVRPPETISRRSEPATGMVFTS